MSTGRNSSVENGAQLWKAFEGSKCHGLQTADEIEVFYFCVSWSATQSGNTLGGKLA